MSANPKWCPKWCRCYEKTQPDEIPREHGDPVKAFRFRNGALMVFDAQDRQVPCLQGFDVKTYERLVDLFPNVANNITFADMRNR